MDKGTETGTMALIHTLLHKALKPESTEENIINKKILFGSSTENKIERWWGELHHRMEVFFKSQLATLVESGEYQDGNVVHQ